MHVDLPGPFVLCRRERNVKRELSKDDDKLITRLWAILDREDAPEARIGQALDLLNQESATGKAPGRSCEIAESFSRLKQAGDAPKPSSDRRKKKQAPVLIGNSAAMQAVEAAIQRISNTSATVLLRGESGTGKELVAQRIHGLSERADQPFVVVHCAAIPETLIETTLFGQERGAFTGANQARKGRLEQAAGGTLFLDEVGDIPLSTQVKLLRVLQDKTFERVGGEETFSVNVRVIAATHRHLEAMVHTGEFREDLYYRLNVVPLTLPPLRAGGTTCLCSLCIFSTNSMTPDNRHVQLGQDLVHMMSVYHWPGNIRELQNCIERLVVLAETSPVNLEAIPESLTPYFDHMRTVQFQPPPSRTALQPSKHSPHAWMQSNGTVFARPSGSRLGEGEGGQTVGHDAASSRYRSPNIGLSKNPDHRSPASSMIDLGKSQKPQDNSSRRPWFGTVSLTRKLTSDHQ